MICPEIIKNFLLYHFPQKLPLFMHKMVRKKIYIHIHKCGPSNFHQRHLFNYLENFYHQGGAQFRVMMSQLISIPLFLSLFPPFKKRTHFPVSSPPRELPTPFLLPIHADAIGTHTKSKTVYIPIVYFICIVNTNTIS